MKWLSRLLFCTALVAQPAFAGSIAVTPGSGTTIGAGTDGTAQIPATILCGATASAVLYATCVNQAIVNASGQLLVNVGASVLPTGASTSANQPSTVAAAGTTTTGTTGTVVGCAATTSAPTDTTGSSWLLSCDVNGGLRVNGSGVTQPISAASLPLPSGASTSANQPTAATVGSTSSGQSGTVAMGFVTTAAPTYTTAQSDPLSLDTAGNVRVNCTAGCSSSTNITQWNTVALGSPSNYGTSPGAVSVIGVNAFVTNANANGQTTMANSSPVVIASNQTVIPASPTAAATGGANNYNVIWPNNTTGVNIKASAGTVYSAQFGNIGTVAYYVKLYNKATAPTCGTDTPVKRWIVPVASTAANGAGSNITITVGSAFATGIGICVTAGITDADTTAVAASTALINVDYQ